MTAPFPVTTVDAPPAPPKGWRWTLLREVARLESGHTPSRREPSYWDGGDVPWLSLKDIRGLAGRYITETEDKPTPKGIDNSSARVLPRGTVAFCRTASVGKVAILGRDMATSQDFANWICGPDLLPEYLYEALRASGGQFDKEKQGTTHKTIYMPVLERFCVLLPPLAEQHRIADILDKADAIRRKRKEAIALSEELLRSAFLDMFGDPVTNPKGWPVKPLGQLGRVTTGRTPPSAAPGMFNGPVPFVTPGDLESREPVRRTLTVDGARESRVVRAGAALVCCIGATVGKMAKAPNELAFNQQINGIEWHSLVNDDFGIAALRFFKTRIATSASSTTLPILNKSSFEKLEIPVPPVEQQTVFSRRSEVCRKVGEAQEQTLSQADTLFNSLVTRAFSGSLEPPR